MKNEEFLEELMLALQADAAGEKVSPDGTTPFDSLVHKMGTDSDLQQAFRDFLASGLFYGLISQNQKASSALRQTVKKLDLRADVQKAKVRGLLKSEKLDGQNRAEIFYWLRLLGATPTFRVLEREDKLRMSDPSTWLDIISSQVTSPKLAEEVSKLAAEKTLSEKGFSFLVPMLRKRTGDDFARYVPLMLKGFSNQDQLKIAKKLDRSYGLGLTQLALKEQKKPARRPQPRSPSGKNPPKLLRVVKSDREARQRQLAIAGS